MKNEEIKKRSARQKGQVPPSMSSTSFLHSGYIWTPPSNAGEKWAGIEWIETGFALTVSCIPLIAVLALPAIYDVLSFKAVNFYNTTSHFTTSKTTFIPDFLFLPNKKRLPKGFVVAEKIGRILLIHSATAECRNLILSCSSSPKINLP